MVSANGVLQHPAPTNPIIYTLPLLQCSNCNHDRHPLKSVSKRRCCSPSTIESTKEILVTEVIMIMFLSLFQVFWGMCMGQVQDRNCHCHAELLYCKTLDQTNGDLKMATYHLQPKTITLPWHLTIKSDTYYLQPKTATHLGTVNHNYHLQPKTATHLYTVKHTYYLQPKTATHFGTVKHLPFTAQDCHIPLYSQTHLLFTAQDCHTLWYSQTLTIYSPRLPHTLVQTHLPFTAQDCHTL